MVEESTKCTFLLTKYVFEFKTGKLPQLILFSWVPLSLSGYIVLLEADLLNGLTVGVMEESCVPTICIPSRCPGASPRRIQPNAKGKSVILSDKFILKNISGSILSPTSSVGVWISYGLLTLVRLAPPH